MAMWAEPSVGHALRANPAYRVWRCGWREGVDCRLKGGHDVKGWLADQATRGGGGFGKGQRVAVQRAADVYWAGERGAKIHLERMAAAPYPHRA